MRFFFLSTSQIHAVMYFSQRPTNFQVHVYVQIKIQKTIAEVSMTLCGQIVPLVSSFGKNTWSLD
jgi:hypothetical protein